MTNYYNRIIVSSHGIKEFLSYKVKLNPDQRSKQTKKFSDLIIYEKKRLEQKR